MIHRFKALGVNIIMDVNSGSIHVVDDAAYEMADCFGADKQINWDKANALLKRFDQKDIAESYSELNSLIKAEYLFSDDWHEELGGLDKRSVIKAMCLHVCHDCNMRCGYCFADAGAFSGRRGMMSAEIGKQAIDFLIASSENRKNIEVDFFGGEPLMNFDVVKYITEYACEQGEKHGKNFRLTLTTNGLLLDESVRDYVNQYMANVVLSVDGRPEVNDRMRKRMDGSGSYEHIIRKFLDLAESRNHDNYYIRGTFTRHNLDFSKDVLHLANQGFKQISVEPAIGPEDCDYAIRAEDLPVIFKEYEKLAREIVERKRRRKGFNFFHFMIDFENGPCALKRIGGCGAGHEYVAVTPDGNIYPCHQLVRGDAFLMGNVADGKINENVRNQFAGNNLYAREACRSCWAKFYCSGGCAAGAFNVNGSISTPDAIACELERKRLEYAIAVKAVLS